MEQAPRQELITGVPSAEELAAQSEQREITEMTLAPAAGRAALNGASIDEILDINNASLGNGGEPGRVPELPQVELPEPYETPENERPVSREELRKMLGQ